MGSKTTISWTDSTWGPTRGCSRISPGCTNCYAERIAGRFSDPGQAFHGFAVRTNAGSRWTRKVALVPARLADPIRWKKARRIFVNSTSDLFHEELTNEDIAAVFGVMAAAPHHTYQILTKRAKRMREWFEWMDDQIAIDGDPWTTLMRESTTWLAGNGDKTWAKYLAEHDHKEDACFEPWPLPWVQIGVSVENQEAANERIPELIRCPAAVRFLSCEPLLGEVDLDPPLCGSFDRHGDGGYYWNEGTPFCSECDNAERSYGHWLNLEGITWVIAGAESGPGRRSCEVDWLRVIRDACRDNATPFFLKQAFEIPGASTITDIRPIPQVLGRIGELIPTIGVGPNSNEKGYGLVELPYLDGVQYAEFPEVES